MNELTRDELGFVRARRYGRVDRHALEAVLQPQASEQVYVTGVRAGVRTAERVTADPYPMRPGDAILIEPNEKHRLVQEGEEALGFLCIVPNGVSSSKKKVDLSYGPRR